MKEPKVLIFDIETSPNVVYCWRTGYYLTITPDNIVKEREIICIGYKWSGYKRRHVLYWDPKKKKGKDKAMLKKFAEIYNSADMVVAYNGNAFDIKWIKGRMLHHKLPPLAPVKQCDPWLDVKRIANLNSSKMDYVAKFMGYEGKCPMSYKDWVDVMEGSMKALKKMGRYCMQDVEVLDQLFIETRPYIDNGHIHQAFHKDKEICPSCSCETIIKHGIYYTRVGRYQKYRCMSCMHCFKDTRQIKDK